MIDQLSARPGLYTRAEGNGRDNVPARIAHLASWPGIPDSLWILYAGVYFALATMLRVYICIYMCACLDSPGRP